MACTTLNNADNPFTSLLLRCFLAITLVLNACLLSHAQVVEWGLDLTFGNGGRVVTDFSAISSEARAVLLQSDGKIIVAGGVEKIGTFDFALARYDTSGNLDTSFGNGGKVTTDFFGLSDGASAIAIQPDGKIILGGSAGIGKSNTDFALARYDSDGTLDVSFGNGGKVTTDFFGSIDRVNALALQPDGKIVVAGMTINSTIDHGLARYHNDGSLDTSFGSNGKVAIDFFGDIDEAFGLAIQPDEKIVVVGDANVDSNSVRRLALARLNSDGSLDTSFGFSGKIANRIGEARAVALQQDGRIIVAGNLTFTTPNRDFGLTRYNFDGSLDSTFGTGGRVTTDFSGLYDYASAVALQADGKIIVAGISLISDIESNFALARYNSDGLLDSTFGSGGKLTADFSGNSAQAFGVVIQGDGKIILVGAASKADNNFALARFLRIGSADFALVIAPSRINVERGKSVKINVDINRFAGFTGNVTVTAPDLSNIKIKVNRESASTTDASVKFKLKIKGSAPAGSHSLTFSGRDAAGRERFATLILLIQ